MHYHGSNCNCDSLLIAFVGNQKIIIQLSRNMDEAEKEKKKEQEEKERLIKSLAHDVRIHNRINDIRRNCTNGCK